MENKYNQLVSSIPVGATQQKSGSSGSLPSSTFKNLGNITTPYGGETRDEKFHPGIDVANEIGTKIPALTSGKVVDESNGHQQGEKNAGNYVIIKDENGNEHRYSHLNKSYVKVGQYVKAGQTVGEMGNSGNTYSNSGGTGSHLDYRVVSAMGKYINPYSYLKKA